MQLMDTRSPAAIEQKGTVAHLYLAPGRSVPCEGALSASYSRYRIQLSAIQFRT